MYPETSGAYMTDWISKYGDLMVRLELEMELVDHLTVSFREAQHLFFYACLTNLMYIAASSRA